MIRRGQLDVPVVGVARSGWTLEQLASARARASSEHGGGSTRQAFAQLVALLRYVDGDYDDPATFDASATRARRARSARCTTWRSRRACSRPSSRSSAAPGCARGRARRRREAVRPRPRLGAGAERDAPHGRSPSRRSSASITTSARSRCRTSCTSASPTRSSSRSGTATTSRACRSRWPRASASRAAGSFYEEAGAIRDVIQNHLLQVVGFLAMEPPAIDLPGGDPRRAGQGAPHDPAARARATWCAASSAATANEQGVAPDSQVETFAALRLLHRFVALGGRAVLHPRRQVPAGDVHRGARRAQAAAARRCLGVPREGNYVRFRLSPDVTIAHRRARQAPGRG